MNALPPETARFIAAMGETDGTYDSDPETISRWLNGRSPHELIVQCVQDLPLPAQIAFLGEYGQSWKLLLVLSDSHPALGEVAAWVSEMHDVLMLATPSGPPPPAIFIADSWSPKEATDTGGSE